MELKPHVLIVDDELGARQSLEVILEDDYHVLSARSGKEALERLQREAVDLVLLDVNMPYMENWQAYKWLNQQQPDIPVIIISARPPTAGVALRAGRDTFMEKPLEPKHLLDTIRSLVWPKKEVEAMERTGLQPVGI